MKTVSSKRTLFISWDGPGSAYMESLMLPIFARLTQAGWPIDVLQFRWGDEDRLPELTAACASAGVGYRAVSISRRLGPVGPFLTALRGSRDIGAAARHFGSNILMPRANMPALSVLAAKRFRHWPILFDADGLSNDEKVEFSGGNPQGFEYRLMRDVEAQMVRRSKRILVRSRAAIPILVARAGPGVENARFVVVANGRDPETFHPQTVSIRNDCRDGLGIARDAPLIIYAGSIGRGGKYDVAAKFGIFGAIKARRPDARMVILTGAIDEARSALRAAAPAWRDEVLVRRVPPDEMGKWVSAGDVGLAMIAKTFSTSVVQPIKTAEYLLCGVPVIGTPNIGATDIPSAAGVFYDGSNADAAAAWFVNVLLPQRSDLRGQALQVGLQQFSLDRSVADYTNAFSAYL